MGNHFFAFRGSRTEMNPANFAAAVDAPIASVLHIVHHRRRTTEQRCGTNSTRWIYSYALM
jgi:hypothetical protein